MTEPYYRDDRVTLYLGDCREVTEWRSADVLVTDPPYGMAYKSGRRRNAQAIAGDASLSARDDALALWGDRPALVFGTWKQPWQRVDPHRSPQPWALRHRGRT